MLNKIGVPLLFVSALTFTTLSQAQVDDNLITVKTSQSTGYENFNAFVLKNSIKHLSTNKSSFSLLLTGVSTPETTYNSDLTPVSIDNKVEEYNLSEGRIILKVDMNCSTKNSFVHKILSIDSKTGKIKEQKSESLEQDFEMNNALYNVVCI
ncbi:hypothetical protein ACQWTT_001244 [Acinetobacter baumannii]